MYSMWSGVSNYMSTLDRLTFVNVEVGAASYGILGKIPRAFTKSGLTCRAFNAWVFENTPKKRLCVV